MKDGFSLAFEKAPKIVIVSEDGARCRLFIDGIAITGITALKFQAAMDSVAELSLELVCPVLKVSDKG